MEFHQTQNQVARDKTPYRVVNCGRQWGKTTLAVWEMIGLAYVKDDAIIKYYATTIDQARDIAWSMLKEFSQGLITDVNETRLELGIRTRNKKTSKIKLGGYENIETERGKQNDFLVPDEVAQMRNFKYVWEAILEPTLAFRNGQALFISTPRGFNHWYELHQWGQAGKKNWKSWSFTSFDNPFLSKEWLEERRLSSTPEFFAQEYLAQFSRFTGLIYPEFSSETHIHYFDHEYNQHGDYYLGLDFAVRGFTAALVAWMKPDGNLYILDEYKEESNTALHHAEQIKVMMEKYAPFSKYIIYADPAGFHKNQQSNDYRKQIDGQSVWSLADEYIEQGFGLMRANNEVTPGINYVRQLLRANRIHIHPRISKLPDELFQYQWKDQPEKQVGLKEAPEEPRKVNDHLVDALRYLIYSKPTPPEEEEVKRITTFPMYFPPPKIDVPDPDDVQITPITFGSAYDT